MTQLESFRQPRCAWCQRMRAVRRRQLLTRESRRGAQLAEPEPQEAASELPRPHARGGAARIMARHDAWRHGPHRAIATEVATDRTHLKVDFSKVYSLNRGRWGRAIQRSSL